MHRERRALFAHSVRRRELVIVSIVAIVGVLWAALGLVIIIACLGRGNGP